MSVSGRIRVGTPGFQPKRLQQARQARGIPTMLALADLLGVSTSSISRWEDGSSTPTPEMLEELSAALKVRPAFFLRRSLDEGGTAFLRSLASARKRDIARQKARMEWLQDIAAVVEHYVELPTVNIPDELANLDYKTLRDEELEAIASHLRRHWQLGTGPILNVIPVLERAGFVVACDEMGTSTLDGLCSWLNGRPYILLATDKMSYFRRQMDAAHEMAHAVLHRAVTTAELKADFDLIERQAFRLGSAFLMPSESFPLEVGTPSLSRFRQCKDRWRVSVKAMIRRYQDLQLLDENDARQLYKYYSARGWNRGEPGDDSIAPAAAKMLAEAVKLIVSSNVRSKEELIASDFVLSSRDIEQLCGLDLGWLEKQTAEVLPLRVRQESVQRFHTAADVVPFQRRS